MTGAGYKIVLFVIDKTLGFQRSRGSISLTDFEKATALSRQRVKTAIKQAKNMCIITAERNGTRKTIYALNSDIEKWQTRKPNHPSELGNQITPDWASKSPQARKLDTPRNSFPRILYLEVTNL